MHDLFAMQIQDCFTNISKIVSDLGFGQGVLFDSLKQCSSIGVLKHHVSNLSVFIDLIVEELNDVRMGEFVVKNNLIFGQFIYLGITLDLLFLQQQCLRNLNFWQVWPVHKIQIQSWHDCFHSPSIINTVLWAFFKEIIWFDIDCKISEH